MEYDITIEICNKINKFIGERFFITGNFNDWVPDTLPLGTIPAHGETSRFVLERVKKSPLEFKITRGSWTTLTTDAKGKFQLPYTLDLEKDSLIQVQIEGWRDTFPASTASAQVHILNEAFYFPELDAYKKVWIYLPKDYHTSRIHYPVIYMHDGQHLFDEAVATGRKGPIEWEVDETIDVSANDAIVIAIAGAPDGQTRHTDYLVHPTAHFPEPFGRIYLKDIVQTLKPYVDKSYRTLPDRKNTAMAGSSLGGLLSIYAGLFYPDVFGSIGAFSPSIWIDGGRLYQNFGDILQQDGTNQYQGQNYYLYGGALEDRITPNGTEVDMVRHIRRSANFLREITRSGVEISINPEGGHGAWYWRQAFPLFHEWWHKNLL